MRKHSKFWAENPVLVEVDGKITAARFIPFNTLPEHRVWHAMWTRCTNPNHVGFERYGAKGITICDRWKDFTAFYMDMGPRPTPKHSIDRRNTRGNYEPGNCHWVTFDVQARNKANAVYVEINGEQHRVMDVARRAGLDPTCVYSRLKIGWTIEEALTTPVNKHKKRRHPRTSG